MVDEPSDGPPPDTPPSSPSVSTPAPAPHVAAPRARSATADFLIQLFSITAGILIALWIDGRIAENREQALVDQAYEAIAVEL
jgi:hypothetical protein